MLQIISRIEDFIYFLQQFFPRMLTGSHTLPGRKVTDEAAARRQTGFAAAHGHDAIFTKTEDIDIHQASKRMGILYPAARFLNPG